MFAQRAHQSAVSVLAEHCRAFFAGAPVDVGMSIDIASIDMVSEVNMVSFRPRLLTSCYAARHRLLPCDIEFHSAASRWRLRDPESVRLASSLGAGKLEKRFTPLLHPPPPLPFQHRGEIRNLSGPIRMH